MSEGVEPSASDPPETTPAEPTTTRRWFLAGSGFVVLGAAGGVVTQLARRTPTAAAPPTPPQQLVAAWEAEQDLLRDLTATTGGSVTTRLVITQVPADHTAHADALRALLDSYPHRSGPSSPAASPTGTPRTRAQLRAAEQRAATDAAARAAASHGDVAALLASIAACESTHVALLS